MEYVHVSWGNQENADPTLGRTSDWPVTTINLFADLIMSSATMAAYMGVFVLAAAVAPLLALVCLPCFLWGKVWSKVKPQGSEDCPKARLLP
jgi:cytochrome c oxidase assembly factor CtaG